jgi:maleylacetate reductase
MLTGTVHWMAQERVIHGRPVAQAVRGEIERLGVKRVLLLTTRSLTNGKLIREVTSALGDRCVGKFDTIRAHSPREAVIGGAALARELDADHLLAIGGGSVTDATKTMLLALWRDIRDVDGLMSLASRRGAPALTVLDSDTMRMTAVPTTLSAAEFSSSAGVTDTERKVKLSFNHPLMAPSPPY